MNLPPLPGGYKYSSVTGPPYVVVAEGPNGEEVSASGSELDEALTKVRQEITRKR